MVKKGVAFDDLPKKVSQLKDIQSLIYNASLLPGKISTVMDKMSTQVVHLYDLMAT